MPATDTGCLVIFFPVEGYMDLKASYPYALAGVFVVVFGWLAVEPVSRAVWVAEVIPVAIVFALLVFTFGVFRFSNTAYSLMAVWLFWHTIGGHYTFANVPFGWVTELIGAERNHFDRIGHFSVGFYAYPMMELLLRRRLCGPLTASFFALFFIMSIAAGYEIVEWWYAVAEGGEAGVEFLGSQGDVWDAQKDMLADTLGAVAVIMLYWLVRPDKRRA
jgi:putative membrane protein